MNLLADEGVDKPIVDKLRQDGHEVAYIAEMSPGIDDDTILRQANDSGALLLTLDKDFGELVFRVYDILKVHKEKRKRPLKKSELNTPLS